MTVREEREVRAPPAMALAALATAGENIGLTVRDVRAKEGLLLMTTRLRVRGLALGFVVSAHAQRFNEVTRLAIDVTPILGSWALKSSDKLLGQLVHEFQEVMSAPQGRIRTPERAASGGRPFGVVPQVLGVAWALLGVVFFGIWAGGWWWLAAIVAVAGGSALFAPRPERWWSIFVTVLAILSLPFGLLGAVGRRMARANLLWLGPQDT